MSKYSKEYLVVVQSLSLDWLFATPWTAAHQASLSFTISRNLLRLMSIESVMPANWRDKGKKEISSTALKLLIPGSAAPCAAAAAAKSLQSCPTLCDSMDCSTPVFPVHHHLLELTQTHVHWVGDVIQPSCPLLSPFPPAFNLSQHQGLLQWISSSHQVAKVFELQHQSFQWIFRVDFL